MKFGPKMENGSRSARAELSPRARPRSDPKPNMARSRTPSERAPRARPPCGPRRKSAHRPARTQRVPRSKPQPGPGSGKLLPAWAETRSGDREPSISIRRLREVSSRTKPRSTASRNPSLILFLLRSLSCAAASDSERPTSGG
jgi:hypothetical protein